MSGPGFHTNRGKDLVIFTIYERPLDYPEGYVVREVIISPGIPRPLPGAGKTAPTLEAARKLVPPGLYCMCRMPDDEPQIVESWI